MRVKVLFFGILKDIAGRASDELELADGARLGGVFEHYAERIPRLREMAASVVMARNHEFGGPADPLADGDEVALLPPVSGGTGVALAGPEIVDGGHVFALTRTAIDVNRIKAKLITGSEGAVVVFEGTVRNNTKGRRTLYLDYECYPEMALKQMTAIGLEIAQTYPIGRIGMVHRLGRLLIGETSVAVVATAPHRRAAFEAAHEGLNRLKRLVPIWKKEHFADGEVWVEGEWDSGVPKASA
jgi:molybdopterin synthase catalytic subunit